MTNMPQTSRPRQMGGLEDQGSPGAAALSELAQAPTVGRAVEAVCEFLGMDIAFASRIVDGQQVLEVIRGDNDSFGVPEGARLPVEQTYCHRVLNGRLPNMIPDVRADERAASLPITAALGVRAFVSVPLKFSDGSLYGTLCAASREPMVGSLGYRELQFLHVFARIVADQLERAELESAARHLQLQAAGAKTLIAAVEARDAYTGEHSQAVVEHAAAVARRLGLSEEEVVDVSHVALLHDIGKIAIPDAILRKPGRLTDEEWEVMRSHPIASERLIRNVEGLGHLAPAVRAEHERWDGSGYPDRLAGGDIPIASRITLVCDAYHAMTSDRPYRSALTPGGAREELARGSGTQFCPEAARALLEILGD
jgi:response regulator RpfG family c-di-GMP phosphodiesterase